MKTLDLQQAADFLKIHPDTLRVRAAAGKVRGYKPGRRWVFTEPDLLEYLHKNEAKCRSTTVQVHHIGGSDSRSAVKKLEERLARKAGGERKHLKPV